MLELIHGAKVPFAYKLHEGYTSDGSLIWANVNASNIIEVFKRFLEVEQGQLFSLFLELPTNLKDEEAINETANTDPGVLAAFHKDVYYLDHISGDMFLQLMDIMGTVMIHDGMSAFGLVSQRGNEIGKYKYNIMKAYSDAGDLTPLKEMFERAGIRENPTLITAWNLFSSEAPGESSRYTENGRDMYTVLEALTERGMYKAETREA